MNRLDSDALNAADKGHLESALLAQLIDSELTPTAASAARLHLSACPSCQAKYQDFRKLSDELDRSLTVCHPVPVLDRSTLSARLASQVNGPVAPRRSLLRPFGWSISVAAALALAVLFVPQWISMHGGRAKAGSGSSLTASSLAPAITVDGECFVLLTYSNPDIPIDSPRIVEMEVPVRSLADAGIVFEPMSQQAAWPDRSVRADVLLGMDGQPLGVHVLTAE